jgi:hypothetical protein
VESELFWLSAMAQLFVSLRFTLLVRQFEKPHVTAKVLQLARGQRQDSWLAAAVIWGMILCKGLPWCDALSLGGFVALAWLVFRACQRINALVRVG